MRTKKELKGYLPLALIALFAWIILMVMLLTACSTKTTTEKSIYTNYSLLNQPELHDQIMFLLEKGLYLDKDKIIRVLPKIEHQYTEESNNIWFWEDEESGVTYIVTPQGGITPRLDLDGSIILSRRIQAELNSKQTKKDDNNNNNFNRQQSEQDRNIEDIAN